MPKSRLVTARPYYLALLAVGVACLALGWTVGAGAACGTSCRFDVQLFGAMGTWAGSLLTGGTLLFLAIQVTGDDRHRRAQRLAEDASMDAIARSCVLRTAPAPTKENVPQRVAMTFKNNTSFPITDLAVYFGSALLQDYRGRPVSTSLNAVGASAWTALVDLSSLGLTALPEAQNDAHRVLNESVEPHLAFQFSIGARRWERTQGRTSRVR